MPKFSLVLFKNDASENPKRPFLTVMAKDEDGNEYEGGLWYASDDQGNRKVTKKGDEYWTGSLKPKEGGSFSGKAGAAKAAPSSRKQAREENPF